ncbi:phytoene desaturase family protein [Bacillus alkalisoli]|uniref:phytoene desaturase family protein n=1 Tax=Bacillus alkalisoli TaxID=2011008 RepID=UPI000C243A5D|nr:phytoene desaturase family protein [Bacillus alkalisoli]
MSKKVIVIGGGLGGLSAAIRLKADGYHVTVLEQGERLGGKLNIRTGSGFSFDTGPSILTMPWVLEQLFKCVNRNVHDYLTIQKIEPQWRTFFEDGTKIDMTSELPTMLSEIRKLSDKDANQFFEYMNFASKMYEYSLKSFYKKSLSGLNDLRALHNIRELFTMDPMKSMDQITKKHFENKHVQQLFNFLIMYIGSSPYQAPAVLTQLAYVQLGLGIYYVKGGMYKIAEALTQVLEELEINYQLNCKVSKIITEGDKAKGVMLQDGSIIHSDIIVSNLEAIPTYRTLLAEHPRSHESTNNLQKYSPTVSGLVLLLGVNKEFKQLAHHNFFFSENPEKEFHEIFNEGKPTEDPTIYIGVSSKSDPSQAPYGKENLFVLTHVPPLKERENWDVYRDTYRSIILRKLERMGLKDLQKSIEFEYRFTPNDIQNLYGSNGGSIYGVVTDRKKNGGFKIPCRSNILSNLYFTGGSTHPGGGVPMVILSGQLTADAIKENNFSVSEDIG